MKGNPKAYSTIIECVSEALMDVQAPDSRKEQFTRFALKYFKQLNHTKSTDIKTVSLNMKPWKAIELPEDCVRWITMGLQCGEDIKTFVRDTYPVALLHEKDGNGVKIANEPCPDYFDFSDWETDDISLPFYNVNTQGEDPGKIFGLMVKDNGLAYFTENMNKDSCEIQFRGKLPADTKIYLQYLSNGINPCGETMVHPFFKEFIIAGIHVERCRFGSREEKLMLSDAKEEFDRQFWIVQDLTWDWSTEDIMEILKSGYGLYPKK